MPTLSAFTSLSVFGYPIPERSEATPGLFNQIFSGLSANLDRLNSDVSNIVGSSVGTTESVLGFSSNTLRAESGNTILLAVGTQSLLARNNLSYTSTYNALWFGSAASSKESRIQNAFNQAVADNVRYVVIPQVLLPYSSSSVTYNNLVRPVRENGNPSVLDVQAYGADPAGVLDATAAIQSCGSAWASYLTANTGNAGDVWLFSPGRYKTTAPVTVTVTSVPATGTKLISGYGATLMPSSITTGYGLTVKTSLQGGFIRNLTIEGLMFDGPDSTDSATGMLRCTNDNAQAFFTQLVLRDIVCEHFMGHGVTLDGAVAIDQSQMYGCHLQAASANTLGFPLNLINATALEIHGGAFVLGKNNINCTSGELRIYGGKFLSAWNEAIVANPATAVYLYGPNLENCWLSGPAAPTWGTNQAAIYTNGRVFSFGAFLVSNNSSYIRYVHRVAGSGNYIESLIVGADDISNTCQYVVRTEGATNSKIQVIACGSGLSGSVVNGNSTGIVQALGCRNTPDTYTSYPSGDRGDASVTLTQLVDFDVQLFNTPLTSARTAILAANTDSPGAKFRIIRGPAATGAFPLSVITLLGGNRILSTASQWVDVIFDGTNWRESASGVIGPPTAQVLANSGSLAAPTLAFSSETSLGLYRSDTSTIAQSYGTFAASLYSSTAASSGVDFRVTPNNALRMAGNLTSQNFYLDVGNLFIRDGNGGSGAGVLLPNSGAALQPTYAFNSEASFGFYRSAASVMALSYGGLGIKAGANASCGTAVLGSNGSVNVANTYVKTGDLIFLTDQSPGGTLGDLEVGGIRNSSGFTIQSTSVTDTSTVAWLIVRPG